MLMLGFQLVKLDDAGRGMPVKFDCSEEILSDSQYSAAEASSGASRQYLFLLTNEALHYQT